MQNAKCKMIDNVVILSEHSESKDLRISLSSAPTAARAQGIILHFLKKEKPLLGISVRENAATDILRRSPVGTDLPGSPYRGGSGYGRWYPPLHFADTEIYLNNLIFPENITQNPGYTRDNTMDFSRFCGMILENAPDILHGHITMYRNFIVMIIIFFPFCTHFRKFLSV